MAKTKAKPDPALEAELVAGFTAYLKGKKTKGTTPGLSALRVLYLEAAYDLLRAEKITDAPPRDQVALAYSFPSKGAARNAKKATLGECHHAELKGKGECGELEKKALITVHPSEFESDERVLAVLAHEMLHAALGPGVGHGSPFPSRAKALGLDGKPTCTTCGEGFRKWIEYARPKLPKFPSGALEITRKVQGTRNRLYMCMCPVKLRCGRDDLDATCNVCESPFLLVEGKTGTRIVGGGEEASE